MASRTKSEGLDAEGIGARRRKRRRRRFVRGIFRMLMWVLVLAGAFVFGLGYGRISSNTRNLSGGKAMIANDRGPLTATLPTKTVTVTKTVIKKVKVRVKARAKR